jgi:hypothetical protein
MGTAGTLAGSPTRAGTLAANPGQHKARGAAVKGSPRVKRDFRGF